MKLKNPFSDLTAFEKLLWLCSVLLVLVSFLFTTQKDYLSLVTSLVGVTALIFIAKGYVFGQILVIFFSIFYGIISFYFEYYGEMLTYLCMSAPAAAAATVSWIKHPYKESKTVEISTLSSKSKLFLIISTPIVTIAFYFILNFFNTKNLLFSTISITTSFIASYLTYCRSPFYALGYCANDIVLIVLWTLAAIKEPSSSPMILCFVAFLANDLYGFVNWRKMETLQK